MILSKEGYGAPVRSPLRRRIACLLLTAMLLFVAAAPAGGALAAESGMVRVALSSMGLPTSVTINLSGQYAIPEKPSINLVSGKSYTLSYSGNQLYINVDGSNIAMGTSFTIKRYADKSGSGGYISLNNPKYGNRSYMGDMIVRGNEGYVRLINRIYMEDYLYGVVPYEMSNLFPLEALKAQAICARSYAYKRMKGSGVYDVTDTTDAQVYKGYRAAEDVAIRAVNDTRGMVLKYQGSVIDCYYSASNGGQTEDPNNMWFGPERAPDCYVVKDDPYDLRNPMSLTMTTTINRSGHILNPAVANALKSKALEQLGSSFNGDPSYSQITSISSFQLTDPRVIDPRSSASRYYQYASVTMRLRAMRTDGVQEERDVSFKISLHNDIKPAMVSEDLRLFSLTDDGTTWTLTVGRYGHGAGLSQRGAEQMANEGMTYSQILAFYFVGAQTATLDLSNEPLTQYTGASSSGVIAQGTVKVSSSLTVRSSRSTSASSLGTLKNGASVDIIETSGDWYGIVYGSKTGYVSAAYITNVSYLNNTATQAPDTSQTGGAVIMVGTVVLPDASSTLPVLQVKSTLGTQLGVLGNGTRVEIVEYDQGFYGIRYNGYTAYIAPENVRIDEYVAAGSTPQPTPQPTPEAITVYAAGTIVTESSPSVNLRTGPSSQFDLVGALPKGSAVELIGSTAGWYRVRYNNTIIGWVMGTYVQTSGTVPETGYNGTAGSTGDYTGGYTPPAATPAPTPTPAPRTGKTSAKCDVYSMPDGSTFATLPKGTSFREVETRTGGWSRVEALDVLGWVKSEFLSYDDGSSSASSSTSSQTSSSTASATTTTAVKLRAGAGTSYKSFGTVPAKTKVSVASKGSTWTKVVYKDQTGYIMTKYLKF